MEIEEAIGLVTSNASPIEEDILKGIPSTPSDHNIKFYWKISRKIKFTFRENDKMRLLSDFSMQRKNMLRKIDKCCILTFGVGLFVSPFLWWDVL